MGGRVVTEYVRYARAVTLRGRAYSWAEIAVELGYRSRSGAEHAVDRGLAGSMLIPGLRVVMYRRLDRFWDRLNGLEPLVVAGEVDHYLEVLQGVHLMNLRLEDAIGGARVPPGLRDVEALVARRRPHLPTVDAVRRDERLMMRGLEATLDMMRDGFANRSGVYKALDRDLRQLLLEAATLYFEIELAEVRDAWHELDLAVRRRPVEGTVLLDAFTALGDVLERMTVFDLPGTPNRLGKNLEMVSSGHGYPTHDTKFPGQRSTFPDQPLVLP